MESAYSTDALSCWEIAWTSFNSISVCWQVYIHIVIYIYEFCSSRWCLAVHGRTPISARFRHGFQLRLENLLHVHVLQTTSCNSCGKYKANWKLCLFSMQLSTMSRIGYFWVATYEGCGGVRVDTRRYTARWVVSFKISLLHSMVRGNISRSTQRSLVFFERSSLVANRPTNLWVVGEFLLNSAEKTL